MISGRSPSPRYEFKHEPGPARLFGSLDGSHNGFGTLRSASFFEGGHVGFKKGD